MNKLNPQRRAQVIAALVEGNSINATVRMTGVAKNTVLKLLADLGTACANYQDMVFRNLSCKRVQCDEIWSFCHAKAKNVPAEKLGVFGYGDVWTWVAIDADTKLVPCWHIGRRDGLAAYQFITDLAGRVSGGAAGRDGDVGSKANRARRSSRPPAPRARSAPRPKRENMN